MVTTKDFQITGQSKTLQETCLIYQGQSETSIKDTSKKNCCDCQNSRTVKVFL